MEQYHHELERIKRVLRDNPKGMTVTDISRTIHSNRNSVAKYLDILLISGHAEMISFGPAKVYFPSRRVPITSLINYTSDNVVVLDKDLKIVQVNENLIEAFNLKINKLIGTKISNIKIPVTQSQSFLQKLHDAVEGTEVLIETCISINEEDKYYSIRFIPTTFEDGTTGVTVIIKDTTKEKCAKQNIKEHEEKFKLLTETSFHGVLIHENGTIIESNSKLATMFGYSRSEVIGMTALDVVKLASKSQLEKKLMEGCDRPFVATAKKKDGSQIQVEIQGKKIDSNQRNIHIVSIRKKHEK